MFNQKAIEHIGHYVYALFDSKQQFIPFYIGKGQGNRVFSHAEGVVLTETSAEEYLSPKLELIREIKNEGRNVIHKIIRFDLSEEAALDLEASLIDLVNHMHPDTLKNQISGHGVAEGFYDATDLAISLAGEKLNTEEPVLIIKIERLWTELLQFYGASSQIPTEKIYNAVRGNWKISISRAQRAHFILAVSRGIVREVFIADSWIDSTEKGRKCFEGRHMISNDFKGKSVSHLFKHGGQNPIRYIEC
jgi:hypothetical protein